MNKFEAFLKALLKSVFKEYPYDKERAKTSLETIIKFKQTGRRK